jgi:16S rRNA (guanine527-N7)-methyltransferase
MEFDRFDELLGRGARHLGIGLDGKQSQNLHRYFLQLRHWSRKINLIARDSSDEQIIENHFIDSLALLNLFDASTARLLDIGTGAGFPGLVCKAARPELTVGLVEPRLKRVSFLRQVIRQLELSGVIIQACRLEDGIELEDQAGYGWVVSRAVTDIGAFLQMCGRFKQYGSRIVCMKGPRYQAELDAQADAVHGWHLQLTRLYRLPYSGAQRALLVFK